MQRRRQVPADLRQSIGQDDLVWHAEYEEEQLRSMLADRLVQCIHQSPARSTSNEAAYVNGQCYVLQAARLNELDRVDALASVHTWCSSPGFPS